MKHVYRYDREELKDLFELMASLTPKKVNLVRFITCFVAGTDIPTQDICNSPRCMAGHAAVANLLPSLGLYVMEYFSKNPGKGVRLLNNDLANAQPGSDFEVEAGNGQNAAEFDPSMFQVGGMSIFDKQLFEKIPSLRAGSVEGHVYDRLLALHRILRTAGYSPKISQQHTLNQTWPEVEPESPPREVKYEGRKIKVA